MLLEIEMNLSNLIEVLVSSCTVLNKYYFCSSMKHIYDINWIEQDEVYDLLEWDYSNQGLSVHK